MKSTVWTFDDLWEEGYRFDEVISKRYCFVDRKFAKDEKEAMQFLAVAYKFIPKHQGTSKPLDSVRFLYDTSAVIMESA